MKTRGMKKTARARSALRLDETPARDESAFLDVDSSQHVVSVTARQRWNGLHPRSSIQVAVGTFGEVRLPAKRLLIDITEIDLGDDDDNGSGAEGDALFEIWSDNLAPLALALTTALRRARADGLIPETPAAPARVS